MIVAACRTDHAATRTMLQAKAKAIRNVKNHAATLATPYDIKSHACAPSFSSSTERRGEEQFAVRSSHLPSSSVPTEHPHLFALELFTYINHHSRHTAYL